ncbi:MAG: adenylosuccinate synthase [Flavobacteriaceae bacterium]|nr:adenylosuccinate synthase [Flavobacteriaceae bacterium]
MSVDLLLGLQWGDEGKGKIVDVLTNDYDIIARFQGGPNAGHTLEFDGIKHVLHTIPSGIFHNSVINIVGNGVVIDPVIFKKELNDLSKYDLKIKNNLYISKKAHLILPTHRLLDAASEAAKGKSKIGSTLKGIGPTYMDKTGRNGIRIGDIINSNWKEKYNSLTKKHLKMLKFFSSKINFDLNELESEFFNAINTLKKLTLIDSENFIHESRSQGKKILAEGAQGSMLDIDFGTYPYVTSSTTTAAGACTGLGVPPNSIKDVFGIFKAYCTRVGSGPFPTELFDKVGKKMQKDGNEYGSTTGRSRRCGWLDLVALKYSIQINGVTKLIMMKGDVLSGLNKIKVCTSYNYLNKQIHHFPFSTESHKIKPNYIELDGWAEDLTKISHKKDFPSNFVNYINFLEDHLKTPISIISVGPDRTQTIII